MFGLSPVVTAVIGLVVLLVLLALLVTTRYKVAGPNESFIITGRKGKALFLPLRQALTGRDHGPDMAALLPLIGRDAAVRRLRAAC